jgi:hypothetical protein
MRSLSFALLPLWPIPEPVAGAVAVAPSGGDPSSHARSTHAADPILPRTSRWVQVYWRDPASCASSAASNKTNALVVDG